MSRYYALKHKCLNSLLMLKRNDKKPYISPGWAYEDEMVDSDDPGIELPPGFDFEKFLNDVNVASQRQEKYP